MVDGRGKQVYVIEQREGRWVQYTLTNAEIVGFPSPLSQDMVNVISDMWGFSRVVDIGKMTMGLFSEFS